MAFSESYLDCSELGLPGESSIGDLIEAAKARLKGTGRIVLGVRCDHEEIPPDQLDDVMATESNLYERVEIITGSAGEVVADALQLTRRVLSETYALTSAASELLAGGTIHAAMQKLVECSGIWSQVHQAVVQSCSLLSIQPASVVIADRTLADWLRDVARMLVGMRDAMESRDYVLLADILRYEMDETLGGWERMLDGLIEFAAGLEPTATT